MIGNAHHHVHHLGVLVVGQILRGHLQCGIGLHLQQQRHHVVGHQRLIFTEMLLVLGRADVGSQDGGVGRAALVQLNAEVVGSHAAVPPALILLHSVLHLAEALLLIRFILI